MKITILTLILSFFSFSSLALDLRFADELIGEGDYYRALTTLKEIEFVHRGKDLGFQGQKRILQVHMKAKDFENFDINVEKLLRNYSSFISVKDEEIIQAEAAFLIGNYGQAYNLIKQTKASSEKKYYFGSFLDTNPEKECASPNCKRIIKAENQIARAHHSKNESLALTLGIIPGLGQVYAGNVSSGIGSFLITSFFTAVSVIAFNNGETAMGIASSAVGGTFYLASIYAGYETARRHNGLRVSQAKNKLYDIPIEIDLIKVIWD